MRPPQSGEAGITTVDRANDQKHQVPHTKGERAKKEKPIMVR